MQEIWLDFGFIFYFIFWILHFFEITHTYTQYMFLICFAFAFYTSPIIFFSFFFILSNTGTESEVSFSLLNGSRNHNNRHSGLDNSTTTTSTRILMSPGTKPVKIAAISGKPRVQRYLSRECEWFFLCLLQLPFLHYYILYNTQNPFILACYTWKMGSSALVSLLVVVAQRRKIEVGGKDFLCQRKNILCIEYLAAGILSR